MRVQPEAIVTNQIGQPGRISQTGIIFEDNAQSLGLIIWAPTRLQASLTSSVNRFWISTNLSTQSNSEFIIKNIILWMKPLIKCFTTLGALFILAFGVALLCGTVYVAINDQIFLGNTSIKWTMLGVSLGLSVTIIGGAAQGIYGICKEKARYVCLFQVFVIIFMIIFIGLGIAVVFAPDWVFNGDCTTSNNEVIRYAADMYNKSALMFCQKDCACALDNTTDSFLNTYNQSEQQTIAKWNLNVDGFKNTEECIRSNISDPEVALFTVIGNIEKLLDCSLWCPGTYDVPNLIFRFGNVNDGKPANYCYDELLSLFNQYNDVAKYALFGAGAVLLLMFLCNMYLCCCNQAKKGRRARDRFMIMDDERDDYDRYDRMDRYERRDRRDDYDRRDRRDDYYDRRRR